MDPRILSACAAFILAALGLGLVSFFIDGRINATAAMGGVVVLVFLTMLTAAAHAERTPGRRRRRRAPWEHDRARGSDRELARRLAPLRSAASDRIRTEMRQHGLHEAEGWKVTEFTRQTAGGSEIVFIPTHAIRMPPARLECVVRIDEATGLAAHECRCEAASGISRGAGV